MKLVRSLPFRDSKTMGVQQCSERAAFGSGEGKRPCRDGSGSLTLMVGSLTLRVGV